MNVKAYLDQIHVIDCRIKNMVRQLEVLKSLAERTTAALSDLPGAKDVHRREGIMAEFIDQKDETQKEIDELMKTRREIVSVIKSVPDLTQRTLLEERYIYARSWRVISKLINYSIAQTYRFHDEALEAVGHILEDSE